MTSDPITFATDAIGRYAVAVNANDMATSGAVPRWFFGHIALSLRHYPIGNRRYHARSRSHLPPVADHALRRPYGNHRCGDPAGGYGDHDGHGGPAGPHRQGKDGYRRPPAAHQGDCRRGHRHRRQGVRRAARGDGHGCRGGGPLQGFSRSAQRAAGGPHRRGLRGGQRHARHYGGGAWPPLWRSWVSPAGGASRWKWMPFPSSRKPKGFAVCWAWTPWDSSVRAAC